ncbi:YpdA family putative bacillithiol disulfide reductase [Sphingobacterium sp. HJSM2_6]|uniref:YpdA family putative bacillithiol disulfide reductase n=1 Tax=Sphingobacterium sp. HJSM2_6 TaxID=3366264 RepID=UPI003BC018B8
MDKIIDVLIVGAGPIGLACGIEAIKNKLTHVILEKGCLVNSLFNYPVNMTFFSTSERLEIGNTPFVTTNPKPRRSEALEYYRRIEQQFQLNTKLFEEVMEVVKKDGLFYVQSTKSNYIARHVIIATGFYDIPMNLNVPGEDLNKVKHYYDDPHYYAKQHVIVVGSSNSSVDAALETFRKGAQVTMVIRGSEISPRVKYWVKPDIENRIASGEIKAYFQSSIIAIAKDSVQIQTASEIRTIPNDFVLALTGYRPNFEFLKKIGIDLQEDDACIPTHNPETMETNINNLYLAGVVCGGLNTHLWFIENSRIHAEQIVQHIVQQKLLS